MNNRLTISAKDEKIPFPAAVRGLKTPVLKLSNINLMAKKNLAAARALPPKRACSQAHKNCMNAERISWYKEALPSKI